jgi:hypothetical protein
MSIPYKSVMQQILKRCPNLNIYGYSQHKYVHSNAMQAEMMEDRYEPLFTTAVEALKELMPTLHEAEYVKSLIEYLERRYAGQKFYQGIVVAACLYLGCELTYRDQSHSSSRNCAVIYDHVGLAVIPPHIKEVSEA